MYWIQEIQQKMQFCHVWQVFIGNMPELFPCLMNNEDSSLFISTRFVIADSSLPTPIFNLPKNQSCPEVFDKNYYQVTKALTQSGAKNTKCHDKQGWTSKPQNHGTVFWNHSWRLVISVHQRISVICKISSWLSASWESYDDRFIGLLVPKVEERWAFDPSPMSNMRLFVSLKHLDPYFS